MVRGLKGDTRRKRKGRQDQDTNTRRHQHRDRNKETTEEKNAPNTYTRRNEDRNLGIAILFGDTYEGPTNALSSQSQMMRGFPPCIAR